MAGTGILTVFGPLSELTVAGVLLHFPHRGTDHAVVSGGAHAPAEELLVQDDMTKRKNPKRASRNKIWPHPFPCRTATPANPALYQLTLGDVKTPLATGVFDPVKDEVRLPGGRRTRDFMKRRLGYRFYAPIDKTKFPTAPAGWCSWYIYWMSITADEMIRNAERLGKHLKPYGAEFCQLDDGWQGGKHGFSVLRDWFALNKRFGVEKIGGMGALARAIKKAGLRPGLWLCPHGQTNPRFFRDRPAAWLRDADGKEQASSWEGKYLLDPTSPEAHAYLKRLFAMLTRWGYEYFKIDGQPLVIDAYRRHRNLFSQPRTPPEEAYRSTLKTIRRTIGPKRFLLGCWGTTWEGIGLFNGCRTGGDDGPSWQQMQEFVRGLLNGFPANNIAWYSDPDTLLVRPTLTEDQARLFATLVGLSGQVLMASDLMYDLPQSRLEILRRVFPTLDARPFDLYRPRIDTFAGLAVKVAHLGRQYDVLAPVNLDQHRRRTHHVAWTHLGLPRDAKCHVFNFWEQAYLGCWPGGVLVNLAPMSCQCLAIVRDNGRPQFLSTSRHVIQGALDVSQLSYDPKRREMSGISEVVAGDQYELRFACPLMPKRRWEIRSARAGSLPVQIGSNNNAPTLRFTSPRSRKIKWSARFQIVPKDCQQDVSATHPPAASFPAPGVTRIGSANDGWHNFAGVMTWLDGKLLGCALGSPTDIYGLKPGSRHTVRCQLVSNDGRSAPGHAAKSASFRVPRRTAV